LVLDGLERRVEAHVIGDTAVDMVADDERDGRGVESSESLGHCFRFSAEIVASIS
jgi:hypothetical protein